MRACLPSPTLSGRRVYDGRCGCSREGGCMMEGVDVVCVWQYEGACGLMCVRGGWVVMKKKLKCMDR